MRTPTFFIAGVPKAGTTSLYHYLAQHPEIYLSPVKEPTFFAADELTGDYFPDDVRELIRRDGERLREYVAGPMNQTLKGGLALDWDTYLQLFRHSGNARAIGEASVAYFWLPSAAQRIRERIPDAKLIFILRDPAERLFSQYLDGLHQFPGKSFRARFDGARAGSDVWSTILDADRYATNLNRFLGFFPRDQIRIFLYEEYRERPHEFLRQIFEFLGVSREPPIDMSRRYHAGLIPRYPSLLRLRPLGFWAGWLPATLRTAVKDWLYAPRTTLRITREDRGMVVEFFRREIEATQELIGRDLSAWLRW